ncbi:hypothetical protein [Vibrio sp. T11.5]|nr:hypothetical protein [Vibrio sp. T11.5]MDA0116947.1 hypothetical protein [Vibrio sp. T11.5]
MPEGKTYVSQYVNDDGKEKGSQPKNTFRPNRTFHTRLADKHVIALSIPMSGRLALVYNVMI